ncbi:hypothetical protein AAFF_G00317040 [Aldrovandia affinis]|uniref:Uncharacterized protein n=1 Tax=Aldrovandia affinis TaxID=143900 RepID=A0AAD7W0J6_9TELE|nr:hypothetical protein AAFF_G00317040 [Aldrovandia affinis]
MWLWASHSGAAKLRSGLQDGRRFDSLTIGPGYSPVESPLGAARRLRVRGLPDQARASSPSTSEADLRSLPRRKSVSRMAGRFGESVVGPARCGAGP